MPEKKYYVVWKGFKPGIFDNWKDCEAQIRGFEGAIYKSFPGLEDAQQAFAGNWKDFVGKKERVSNPGVGNPAHTTVINHNYRMLTFVL